MKDEKQIYEPVFKTSVWYEIDPKIREQLDRIEAKLDRLLANNTTDRIGRGPMGGTG